MGIMRKSRLSHDKQELLIEHFVSSSTSLTAARLCGVNRKTSNSSFLQLREIIALELEVESEAIFGGEVEVDKSYFGAENKGIRPIEAGRQGLHQDHPKRFQRHPNADHRAQNRARQHRLFRQLEGLQRARRVSI